MEAKEVKETREQIMEEDIGLVDKGLLRRYFVEVGSSR